MKLSFVRAAAATAAVTALVAFGAGCSPSAADDADQTNEAVTVDAKSPEGIVRSYYGAARSADPAGTVSELVSDDVLLEAPSVYMANPFGGATRSKERTRS